MTKVSPDASLRARPRSRALNDARSPHPPGAVRLTTARLVLREPDDGDLPFLLELLNDAGFIRFIADRGVRTLEQAREYLHGRLLPHFRMHGFGAFVVERRDDGERLGLCTLISRDTLPDVDIGYAFLARFTGQGYALEGSRALLDHARGTLGMARVIAIANQDNTRSARLLGKLGLRHEGRVRLEAETEELDLFAIP